jgi:hypothetical protein
MVQMQPRAADIVLTIPDLYPYMHLQVRLPNWIQMRGLPPEPLKSGNLVAFQLLTQGNNPAL